MTNPTPEERFSSYLTKLNTPKKGELRRVFSQIVGEIEAEKRSFSKECLELRHEVRKLKAERATIPAAGEGKSLAARCSPALPQPSKEEDWIIKRLEVCYQDDIDCPAEECAMVASCIRRLQAERDQYKEECKSQKGTIGNLKKRNSDLLSTMSGMGKRCRQLIEDNKALLDAKGEADALPQPPTVPYALQSRVVSRPSGEVIRSQNNSGSSETIPAAKLTARAEGGNLTRPPLDISPSKQEMEIGIDYGQQSGDNTVVMVRNVQTGACSTIPIWLAEYIQGIQAERDELLEVLEDKRRLTRELDVALHGEEGAAKQASLCDFIHSVEKLKKDRNQLADELRKRTEDAVRMAKTLNQIADGWHKETCSVETWEDKGCDEECHKENAEKALSDLNFSYTPKP